MNEKPSIIDVLVAVNASVMSEHVDWEKRTGLKNRSVPIDGDYPCYYCGVYGGKHDACRVCIHNPDNELETLLK